MLSSEIAAAQAAYAARPYAVRLRTSHYSCTNRFNTLAEAIHYLSEQYTRATRVTERYRAFDARRSLIELPGGVTVACAEFLGPSLSTY